MSLVHSRSVSAHYQQWQAQRPAAPMPRAHFAQTQSVARPQYSVYQNDRLQLNIPNPNRISPIANLQLQASASSINRAIDKATGTQSSYNNRVELLVDGKEAFDKIYEYVDSARQSIYIEMFLYHGDQTGWDLAQKLVNKRQQGVEVKVLLDALGQVSEKGQVVQYLRDHGVEVELYNRRLFDWQNVNITHRKLVLVDGYKGITGGMNIGDEYAHTWHDLMASVEGEAVQDLQAEFFINWQRAGGRPSLNPPRLPVGVQFGNSATRITVTSPDEPGKEKDTKNAMLTAIHSALHHVYVVSPYFSDEDVVQAIMHAARRGVEVRVVLPGVSDNPVHAVLNKQNAERVLQAGGQVYSVDPGANEEVFAHGKLITVDGIWTSIGSTNLDTRALENNQELNISVTDAQFAQTVENRLFLRNKHALLPFGGEDFSLWERAKAQFFSFFDRVF